VHGLNAAQVKKIKWGKIIKKIKNTATETVSTVVTVVTDTVKDAIKDGAKIANKLSNSVTDITADVKKWTSNDALTVLTKIANELKDFVSFN
jgi:ABC-type transporter Mla subunit MlaD